MIWNKIGKGELVQTVPIPKSRDISETVMVCTCALLRLSSTCKMFTGITCLAQGYTNWRIVEKLWDSGVDQ